MVTGKEPFFAKFEKNAPIFRAVIRQFESTNSIDLPDGYRQFLEICNGGEGPVGEHAYLQLWRLEELIPLNKAYKVEECVPGALIIGTNLGGEAFAFDMESSTRSVVMVPFVGMERDVFVMLGLTFAEFLRERVAWNPDL